MELSCVVEYCSFIVKHFDSLEYDVQSIPSRREIYRQSSVRCRTKVNNTHRNTVTPCMYRFAHNCSFHFCSKKTSLSCWSLEFSMLSKTQHTWGQADPILHTWCIQSSLFTLASPSFPMAKYHQNLIEGISAFDSINAHHAAWFWITRNTDPVCCNYRYHSCVMEAFTASLEVTAD